jgi:uncharacterized damage-inducible protein DinB
VSAESRPFITPDALLAHWQGHRRLTRRVIDAFPEDQLFTFSIGGMRTFGELALEIATMGVPMLRGVVSGDWSVSSSRDPRPKQEILRLWDESTKELDELWRQIPPKRFQETATAFGQYTDALHNLILYVIDNEIHHRGQGYVYLRALGIAPPPFYERE